MDASSAGLSTPNGAGLQALLDKAAIQDVMYRYTRGVDRSDWNLIRSAYHPDAYDDHGDFKGGIDGFIAWLEMRLADAENGMHLLGICLVEFASADLALVETYFVSQRLRPPVGEESRIAAPGTSIWRLRWGRYVDRFERRRGEWRVAHRTVVFDADIDMLPLNASRSGLAVFGTRDRRDCIYLAQGQIAQDQIIDAGRKR